MKKNKHTFEDKLNELNEILAILKTQDLPLEEISKNIKKAKEIYDKCKKELEEAKLTIEEIII